MKALAFVYMPGSSTPIEVPGNSTVSFYVGSRDRTHAFTIPAKDVNVELQPGVIHEVPVEFDEQTERTTYDLLCGDTYCTEPGHEKMTGHIEVVPRSEY